MSSLSDEVYNEFLNLITREKIINFPNECIKYKEKHHIKEHGDRIPKTLFLNIFEKMFYSPKYYFKDLFNLFFDKFCCQKCLFKQENTKDLYSLREIIPIEEIEIYNVSLALLTFFKTDFENKLKILFELTDYDNDGLINEREIKKMFFNMNLLFSSESSEFKSNSNLIYRSLANIKASRYYNMLMFNPGGLYNIIQKEKFIPFDVFYNSIKKIKDYKYSLFPFHISLKEYLDTPKSEIEYLIKENNVNDFITVSNNLISHNNNSLKLIHSNSERTFLKKLFDNKNKKKNFIQLFLEKKKKEKEKEKLYLNKFMKKQSCPITSIIKRNFFHQNSEILTSSTKNYSSKKSNLNQSSSRLDNSLSSIETKEKKKNSLNYINRIRAKSDDIINNEEFTYEKADYEKFNSIEFPPCKINTYKNKYNYDLILPKIKIVEKNDNDNDNENNNNENHSYLLKTYDEIQGDINKILSRNQSITEREKNYINNIMHKIKYKAMKIKKKLICEGPKISSSFYKVSKYN